MVAPGGMPYVLTRENDVFQQVERLAADGQAQLDDLNRLLRLRTSADKPLWESPSVDAKAVHHVQEHWFGSPDVSNPKQKTALPTHRPTTGWWDQWWGDAHEIVRQTFQRAYQVSLGIPGDDPTSVATTFQPGSQCWPITVLWMCGSLLFQGFVTWDQGHVTAVIATPGVDPHYVDPDPKFPGPAGYPEMLKGVRIADPTIDLNKSKTLVVIGHSDSVFQRGYSIGKSGVMVYVSESDPHFEGPSSLKGKTGFRIYKAGQQALPVVIRNGSGDVITRHEITSKP